MIAAGGRSSRGHLLQSAYRAVHLVSKNETAHVGKFDGPARYLGLLVRPPEEN
jgi:hypothetical protein